MKGTTRTFLIGLAMATVLATVTTGAAVAGRCDHGNNPHCAGGGSGGSGGGGTITVVLVNSTDGQAHWGQTVTFDVSTTATDQPWVNLNCYQNGVLVAQGWEGFFAGSLDDQMFGLYSPQWTGGEADCTANLTTPQWAVLASTSFHVYA
jgi:hypothetical protein